MKNSIFAALGLIGLAGAANAETSADNSRRNIERRAVEAVIWGMPAVNYDLMYQEMLKLGGSPTRSSTGGACRTGRTRRSHRIPR